MKKAATKRENEKKELADVVEQDRLIEMKGKLVIACTLLKLTFRPTPIRPKERLSTSTG